MTMFPQDWEFDYGGHSTYRGTVRGGKAANTPLR